MSVVINFHGIGQPGSGVPADEVPYWCPEDLWRGLAEEVAGLRAAGVDVRLTFDDGNRSDVEHALPVLQELFLTASFFVCADRMGRAGYLSGTELRQLRAAGMGVGSHGWSHRNLRQLDAVELRREAVAARHAIGAELGAEVEWFALPFGSYDRRVLAALSDYDHVLTSDGGHARNGTWLVPRISFESGWQVGTITRLCRPPSRFGGLADRLRTSLKRMR